MEEEEEEEEEEEDVVVVVALPVIGRFIDLSKVKAPTIASCVLYIGNNTRMETEINSTRHQQKQSFPNRVSGTRSTWLHSFVL